MRLLAPIAANLLLVASAIGYGGLLRRLIPERFTDLDRLVIILLGGSGILGTILFCVGQFWFTRTPILTVLLLGVALAVRPLLGALRQFPATVRKISFPPIPVAVISLVLIVTAVAGLALLTGDMNNDSIAYHYLGPKVWLRNGVIRAVPDELLTYFPVAVETQYAALMATGGQRAPNFFAVFALTAIILTTASLAMRLGTDASGAWWAAALVVAMPAVYTGAIIGFLDVLFACFLLAAVRLAFDAETLSHYGLFGIFCGISMGTKETAIVAWILLVFCSLVIAIWVVRRAPAAVLKGLAVSCVAAMALASPFYLRNWILYGCPIYPPPPVLLHFFHPKGMLPAMMHELLKNMHDQDQGMGGGLVHFLLLPFNLTYHTSNFNGAGGIGLAPLALGPFGILALRRNAFAKGLLLFAVLQITAWFATAQISRYIIPLYVLGALFGVVGWRTVAGVAPRLGRVLCATVVAISVLYGLGNIVPARRGDLHAAISSSYEQKRMLEQTPRAATFAFLNRDPSIGNILILNDGIAAYFLDKPYIKPWGRWGEQTLGVATAPQVMALLPELHVTHVLDAKDIHGAFRLPDHPPGLTLVFAHGDERVYRVD